MIVQILLTFAICLSIQYTYSKYMAIELAKLEDRIDRKISNLKKS
ncbi:hypothetical protein [Floricoccus penangensis]|nr:hypothetical protein [Floricoccus penangensis]